MIEKLLVTGLWIQSEHLAMIFQQAQESYPQECCGLLIGIAGETENHVLAVLPTENHWNSEIAASLKEVLGTDQGERTQRDRYAIAPETLLLAQKAARSRYWDIIGIYHSHPDHPAIPSECDRLLAWPNYSYLIVSVQAGQVADIRSWRLDQSEQFQQEEIN